MRPRPAIDYLPPELQALLARLLDAIRALTPDEVTTIAAHVTYAPDRQEASRAIWDSGRHHELSWALQAAGEVIGDAATCARGGLPIGGVMHAGDPRSAWGEHCWAVWCAARDAVGALATRASISQAQYDALTRPMRAAGITVHPHDEPLGVAA